jgi:plasmid stabilization system protein ParE
MNRFTLDRNALEDLNDQVMWYENDGGGLGVEFQNAVFDRISLLAIHPRLGTPIFQSVCRSFRVSQKFNRFAIVYRFVGENAWEVIAIWAAERDPETLFDRLTREG